MKIISVEMIPFGSPTEMQRKLQTITGIRYNVRDGKYQGVKFVSLFNFFTGQDVDIYEGELLKVKVFQGNRYKLERSDK